MWGRIDLEHWRETPSLSGRPATESDIKNGIAVFAIPSGSSACDVKLPLCAVHIDQASGHRTPCIAIQVEEAPNGVFVGVRYLEGGNGIGTIEEFELYTDLTDDFHA